jgi:23S rRNA (cytosine1962-C5)-methyltransferase
MKTIRLGSGRERSVLRKHPWIFESAIEEIRGDPLSGETIEVYSQRGDWIARAAFSPSSKIRARIWTWDREEKVDEAFIAHRVQSAIMRRSQFAARTDLSAYREIYAEADGLPGLVVDRYNEFRVVQISTAGAEYWRAAIMAALSSKKDVIGGFERSDLDLARLEGLSGTTGQLWGSQLPDLLEINESGIRYLVDVRHGHKTGFYLDQRENRRFLGESVQPGQKVLNCFSYTGGFTLSALSAGAESVLSIDSSEAALQLARRNVELNSLPMDRTSWMGEDVFTALRGLRDRALSFDCIVLDPPKFAATPAHLKRASRGYKDINLLAFKLLNPGGSLYSFSCSGGLSNELFQKIVSDAALDAGRSAQIVRSLGQPEDHPIALNFPESRYLKGLVCRVLD